MRLHDDEVPVDADLVRGLLADQLPHLAHLDVREIRTAGTVNHIYRLGEDAVVRLPRVARWAGGIEREAQWLPVVARHVTLEVPRPLALGRPTEHYPLPWAVYRWIDGRPYADDLVDDVTAASALAGFVRELRTVDPSGAEPTGRRALAELEAATRDALHACAGDIDVEAALRVWDRALGSAPWDGRPAWVHTDLLRPNLLVDGGRLRAVIDFGAVGVGDPAHDVAAAWAVFGPDGRQAYRSLLGVDDATWERARGYALHQAALIIPYYRTSNPAFVATAVRTVEQALADR
ncbi:MAG: aminoglycoside phosphotransferase family protein [Lapillicoccus sp.]